jgi:hypothetical protein
MRSCCTVFISPSDAALTTISAALGPTSNLNGKTNGEMGPAMRVIWYADHWDVLDGSKHEKIICQWMFEANGRKQVFVYFTHS